MVAVRVVRGFMGAFLSKSSGVEQWHHRHLRRT
jgi:hypothetical protein